MGRLQQCSEIHYTLEMLSGEVLSFWSSRSQWFAKNTSLKCFGFWGVLFFCCLVFVFEFWFVSKGSSCGPIWSGTCCIDWSGAK